MAKKYLIADGVQVHDLLNLFDKDDNVKVLTQAGKVLFMIDEYQSLNSLQDDYGEREIKSVSLIENSLEVFLWV